MAAKKKAAKKKAAKKSARGGKRAGAGRPQGSTKPRNPEARSHRIGVMVNDAELVKLKLAAKREGVPVSTFAHWQVIDRI